MGGLFGRNRSSDNEPKLTDKDNINGIIYLLHTTQYNLDIGMFVINNTKIVDKIIRLHFKGVFIRVILDRKLAMVQESYVARLRRVGVAFRWKPENKYFHHKVMLIDAIIDENACHYGITPTAVTGVYDAAKAKMATNLKDVVVSDSINVVRTFKAEFDRLWDELNSSN